MGPSRTPPFQAVITQLAQGKSAEWELNQHPYLAKMFQDYFTWRTPAGPQVFPWEQQTPCFRRSMKSLSWQWELATFSVNQSQVMALASLGGVGR